MAKKPSPRSKDALPRWYRDKDVPMSLIRRFARQLTERFRPDKIILFGSYAYGTPHDDSDVDILVVMPARSQLGMATGIEIAIDPPFPLDIIVRTPEQMRWRLEEGESFLTEVTTKGKVLYEKDDARGGCATPRPTTGPPANSTAEAIPGMIRLVSCANRARKSSRKRSWKRRA
jgi:predicted nucleotidyltransferase